jgi:5,5'-dehydrodivanillate O-demethylase
MHVGMPTLLNAVVFTTDPVVRMVESLFWRVPIEDERHMVFHVKRVPLVGAEADSYRERLAARRARMDLDQLELTRQIQVGHLRLEQVDRGRTDITRLEDGVAQEGQGRIVDREQERLGRGDVAIIRFRQIWLRELQALADGQPLKSWTRPAAMRPVGRE